MALELVQSVYDLLLGAAHEAAPLEACGLLGGKSGRAVKFYGLDNIDASHEHYSMKPEDQFAAIRDMRSLGLDMLAIWHSHPATPARMSEEDLRLAYTPDVIYVIVSLAAGSAPAVRGFVVQDGTAKEVSIQVVEE